MTLSDLFQVADKEKELCDKNREDDSLRNKDGATFSSGEDSDFEDSKKNNGVVKRSNGQLSGMTYSL